MSEFEILSLTLVNRFGYPVNKVGRHYRTQLTHNLSEFSAIFIHEEIEVKLLFILINSGFLNIFFLLNNNNNLIYI